MCIGLEGGWHTSGEADAARISGGLFDLVPGSRDTWHSDRASTFPYARADGTGLCSGRDAGAFAAGIGFLGGLRGQFAVGRRSPGSTWRVTAQVLVHLFTSFYGTKIA